MKKIIIIGLTLCSLNGCYHIGYASGVITNKAIDSIVIDDTQYNKLIIVDSDLQKTNTENVVQK